MKLTPFLVENSVLLSQADSEAGRAEERESWDHVVELDHGSPHKPLSECDQKLPIVFIVQEILCLRLVETSGALTFRTPSPFTRQGAQADTLPPAEAGGLHTALKDRYFLKKFLCKNNPQERRKNKLSTEMSR